MRANTPLPSKKKDNVGWIDVTYGEAHDEEGVKCEVPYVDFKDVALVGSFNSWDVTAMGYAFYGPNDEGVYYFTTQLEAGAKFKICYDGSWTNCLGY